MKPLAVIALAFLLPSCAFFSKDRRALQGAGVTPDLPDSALVELLRTGTPSFRL